MSILVVGYKPNFYRCIINRSCNCHPEYTTYERESGFQLLSSKDLESLVDDCISFRISNDLSKQDKCDLDIGYRECNFHILFGDSIDSLNKVGGYDSLETVLCLDGARFIVYDFDIYHEELNPFLDLFQKKWENFKQEEALKK